MVLSECNYVHVGIGLPKLYVWVLLNPNTKQSGKSNQTANIITIRAHLAHLSCTARRGFSFQKKKKKKKKKKRKTT